MNILFHFILSPFAAYILSLFWAVMFYDTIVLIEEKSMIEEWILCTILYMLSAIVFRIKSKKQG